MIAEPILYWFGRVGAVLDSQSEQALIRLRALLADRSSSGTPRIPPERDLAETFGVGRRAVRTALEILEEEGVVWRRQGRGTFIGRPAALNGTNARKLAGHTNPIEVMDVRVEIEPALARMAAARATPKLIQQLEKLAAKAAQAVDTPEYEQWDAAFHAKIAAASGNQLFIAIMELIDGIRHNGPWQDFRKRMRSSGRMALSVKQHEAVIDAIRRFHPLDAEAAMRTHLTSLRDMVLAEIGGSNKTASSTQVDTTDNQSEQNDKGNLS